MVSLGLLYIKYLHNEFCMHTLPRVSAYVLGILYNRVCTYKAANIKLFDLRPNRSREVRCQIVGMPVLYHAKCVLAGFTF